ncbi:hypothetical protein QUF72_03520 [Desulfobacterales bacterium HSG2]|nr:hypothetical protein [Desulfobacterales bacterium HSG2]
MPSMNQKIFEMGFSVETVSVYLLCCSLADSDARISVKNLLGVWNATEDELNKGLNALEDRNILIRTVSDQEGNVFYRLAEFKDWV